MSKAALLIGGVSEKMQIQTLRAGCGLIIATPGRLQDLEDRKFADLRHIKLLVLDEADRMLDMGFLPAIRRIVEKLPYQRQTLCFSATMEQSVAELVHEYMRNPVRVALGSVLKPAESVELTAYEVRPDGKMDALRQLLYAQTGQTLVFARTKRGAERIAKSLVRDGFNAATIHGDRSQAQRNKALSGFQDGRFQVLVATDIASRGLHVDDVAHVINYDLPKIAEDFIHRVGRTGRAGSQGHASTLIAGAEIMSDNSLIRDMNGSRIPSVCGNGVNRALADHQEDFISVQILSRKRWAAGGRACGHSPRSRTEGGGYRVGLLRVASGRKLLAAPLTVATLV